MQYFRWSFIVLMFVLTGASCGSSKNGKSKKFVPGTWQAQPITIDGDSRDWPSPYPNYDSKAKIGYATSNDRKYVYVTIETGDELTEMKILKAGMIVSIDTEGGKDASFNINYPLQNDNPDLEVPHQEGGSKEGAIHMQRSLAKNINKGMDQASQYSLEGFSGCNGGYMIAQVTPCGIKIKAKIDEYKELVWEAAIPVKALFGRDSLLPSDAGKPISVCYQVKALKAPKQSSENTGNTNMNSAMGGGGMGNHGGRAGGGSPRTRQAESPMAHLFTVTKTWKQFTLVVQ